MHLNTGRLRDQWHGMSRTGKLAQLMNHAEFPAASLNPADLDRRDLKDGELVALKSRRGRIVLPVAADPGVKPGHVFEPMHWGRRRLCHAGVNELIAPAIDPYSKQPELKHAAVVLERAELPWRGLILSQSSGAGAGEAALAMDAALAPFLAQLDYASLTLAGREAPLLTLHLAARTAPERPLLDAIAAAAGLAEASFRYDDARRDIHKRALIEGERLTGIALFGETAAAGWLRAAMLAEQPAGPLRAWLFAPVSTVPVARPARGRIVCSCKDVSTDQIAAAIAAGAHTLDQVQGRLTCGTGCGACIPEIDRMLGATTVRA